MLKFERLNNRTIRIAIRKRERFFNSTLTSALMIATALHGLALLCFSIKPLHYKFRNHYHHPTEVIIDSGQNFQDIKVALGEKNLSRSLPPLPKRLPAAPPFPELEMALYPEPLPSLPMTTFEELIPLPDAPLDHDHQFSPPVGVHLSETLSNLTLIEDGIPDSWKKQQPMQKLINGYDRISCEVAVDAVTGKIFWTALEKEARPLQNLIKNIRFQPFISPPILYGAIEITFPKEEP